MEQIRICRGAGRTRRGLRWLWPAVLGVACSVAALSAAADGYSDSWGPAVGATLPILEAKDQSGRIRTLGDLTGERGLLLFLSRSADW